MRDNESNVNPLAIRVSSVARVSPLRVCSNFDMFTIEDTLTAAASTFVDAAISLKRFLLVMLAVFVTISHGTRIDYQLSCALIIKVELIGISTLKNLTDHASSHQMRLALMMNNEKWIRNCQSPVVLPKSVKPFILTTGKSNNTER